MSIKEALDIYPKLIVVPVDFNLYNQFSNLFINLLKKYSNLVLQTSIDEAYLDVTIHSKAISPYKLAKKIQYNIKKKLNLSVSIGIGPTLFLAKMASDYKKPYGITFFNKTNLSKLYNLNIEKMYGVGKKTSKRLRKIGINKIGDLLLESNKNKIINTIGDNSYYTFINLLKGKSSDVINPNLYNIPKSISNEKTLNYNISNYDILYKNLILLSKELYKRLEKEGLLYKTINLKFKYSNFKIKQKSITLNDYSSNYNLFKDRLTDLFNDNYKGEQIRLIGCGLSNLILKKDYKFDYNLFNWKNFKNKTN